MYKHVKPLSMLICCVSRQNCRELNFLRPFGVDQPLGKNVKPIQMIKAAVSCLLCQVPVLFYKGPWPKSPAPESTPSFRVCSADNIQVQSAQHDYQNREICLAGDAAKRRTPFKIILYFWVMQCCYVWNRGRHFWRPTKPLHKNKKTSGQAAVEKFNTWCNLWDVTVNRLYGVCLGYDCFVSKVFLFFTEIIFIL